MQIEDNSIKNIYLNFKEQINNKFDNLSRSEKLSELEYMAHTYKSCILNEFQNDTEWNK